MKFQDAVYDYSNIYSLVDFDMSTLGPDVMWCTSSETQITYCLLMVSKKWTQEREFQTRCHHVPLFSYLDHDLQLPNMAPISLLHCLVFLLTCLDFWSKGISTERISSTDWLPEDGEGMAVTETEQVSNQEALSNF